MSNVLPSRTARRFLFALGIAAMALFTAGPASAEDAKTTKTANALLNDSGSYMPPKTAPQPTPVVGRPTPKAHAPKKAKANAHAPKKANARVKTTAPKRAKSSRKV